MTPYSTYGVDLTAGWLLFDGFRRDFDLLAAQQGETASRDLLDAVTGKSLESANGK